MHTGAASKAGVLLGFVLVKHHGLPFGVIVVEVLALHVILRKSHFVAVVVVYLEIQISSKALNHAAHVRRAWIVC